MGTDQDLEHSWNFAVALSLRISGQGHQQTSRALHVRFTLNSRRIAVPQQTTLRAMLDTKATDRRDDSKLRKMSTDGIDHRCLLADEQVPGSVQSQAALLLGRLSRDEPHVWPGDRFADCLGVNGIVLVSLDVGLHIGRRHQLYGVTKRLELA